MELKKVAKVLIDGASSDLTFKYKIPDNLKLTSGQRINVPLRNRESIGTVIDIIQEDISKYNYTLKEISSVVSEKSFLTENLMKLAKWISEFYISPLELVIRSMLPNDSKGNKEKRKIAKYVILNEKVSLEEINLTKKKYHKQFIILNHLSKLKNKEIKLSELINDLGFSNSSIKSLEKKNLVKISDKIVTRDPLKYINYIKNNPLTLNEEQSKALDEIETSRKLISQGEKVKPILLHGVTGSGKTEIYLQAVQKCIELGKEAIILVPEIALTSQTIDRFKQRFHDIQNNITLLHSNLSEGERHDEWRKILDKKSKIVIGARSAVFSPMSNLGLIVIDEEHEMSYKQDTNPRYQARDVAVVRATIERCPIVLASATPSLESWENTQNGKYVLTQLTKRVDNQSLPIVRVIDMKQESKRSKGLSILSLKLKQMIQDRLEKNEQIILFLNRRGFAKSILCPDCGYVVNCKNCSITMTVHKKDNKLICHICGFSQKIHMKCSNCNSNSIINSGYGTERVEELLQETFKYSRIVRIDTDKIRRKNQLQETLNLFKCNKINILIGTQIIAKGLHFPNVTLVGILNSDIGLHIPDFRSSERTFQLLTQVAGRAGRGNLKGEVIIQTYTPHHPAIQFGRHHDFEGFAKEELYMRKEFDHPPFHHIALITVRSINKSSSEVFIKNLYSKLKQQLPKDIYITEALPSPIIKSHNQWRYQIYIKSPNVRKISNYIKKIMKTINTPKDIITTIDVDAYSLI